MCGDDRFSRLSGFGASCGIGRNVLPVLIGLSIVHILVVYNRGGSE